MTRHNARAIACLVAGALLTGCVPHLEPTEPIETDRPDKTESATLVPAGMVQVEGGVTGAKSGGLRTTSIGEALVRLGVHQRLELRIEPFTQTRITSGGASVSGLEDLAVGIKTPLFRSAGTSRLTPEVSLLIATTLPSGARPFRAAGAQPEAIVAAQWQLAAPIGLGLNVSASRGRDGAERYWERGASATLGTTITERVGSYIEWYATRDARERSAAQVVNGGLTGKLNGDFQVDARVGRGLNENTTFVGVGLARRW
jgi:hypothetical protein